jgi:hypothetical protein
MMFKGHCGGAFDRDSYGPKRVEAFGADWIVARGEYGELLFATVEPARFESVVDSWLAERGEDDGEIVRPMGVR